MGIRKGASTTVLGIIHISDIHFVDGPNSAAKRIAQIKGAVLSEAHDLDDLILLLSGDVAFSGKQREYSIATEFVGGLEGALRSIGHTKLLGTIVIPGNHDCDFDNEGEVRPALLSTVSDRIETVASSGDFVEQMLKVQEGFFAFEELISLAPRPKGQRLLWTSEFDSSVGKVLVRCFNTAWLSRKKEMPGQLFFPVQVIPDISGSDANIVLSAFHHPYAWLQPENARTFRRVIETASDVVFTGHEHDGEVYAKNLGDGRHSELC